MSSSGRYDGWAQGKGMPRKESDLYTRPFSARRGDKNQFIKNNFPQEPLGSMPTHANDEG